MTEECEKGGMDYRDVVNSERDLLRARRDYSQTRYDYVLNGLRLKHAVGTFRRRI
ncbi:MAG: hypothetical protein ACREX9_21960 [Gammaproteobacteria bacterium]